MVIRPPELIRRAGTGGSTGSLRPPPGLASAVAEYSQQTFRYAGSLYALPKTIPDEWVVNVGNQTYDGFDRVFADVAPTLDTGERKTFASVELPPDEVYLLRAVATSSHTGVTYHYVIDGARNDGLSGSSPWASPPDDYQLVEGGYVLVEDTASIDIEETSLERAHDDVSALLVGLRVPLEDIESGEGS